MVGENRIYRAQAGDDFSKIGETYGVGFVALRAANPDILPWEVPGKDVIIPGKVILPNTAPHEGLVINIGEMRLYDFTLSKTEPQTYAIGIGREGLTTPMGTYFIGAKVKDPVWRPTQRMMDEDPKLKPVVPPGPENPLGSHALYLADTLYRIHGTNKPWGVGRRASSGCIRMYNPDIEKLFSHVPTKTRVTIISEPIKIAVQDGAVYLEAHPDEDMADAYENDFARDFEVPPGIMTQIIAEAGDARDKLDWQKIRDVLLMRPGYPVKISS